MGARLPADWLQPPALTLTAATLAFSPPRLRPASIVAVPPKEQPLITDRAVPTPPVVTAPAATTAVAANHVRDARVESTPASLAVANAPAPAVENHPQLLAIATPSQANTPLEPAGVSQAYRRRKPVSTPAPVEPARPVAIRTVMPSFPGSSRQTVHINASFTIAADGSVRDVAVVGAQADTAFARGGRTRAAAVAFRSVDRRGQSVGPLHTELRLRASRGRQPRQLHHADRYAHLSRYRRIHGSEDVYARVAAAPCRGCRHG